MNVRPEVDLTIAVHSPVRPIERAVRSVLEGTDAVVRVTVAVHEIDPRLIAKKLTWAGDRVRLLPVRDGMRSPAGPFNAGMAAAEAPWISIMGSDDTLAPHAIDSWLARAQRTGAEVVIPRVQMVEGRAIPTPPTRPGRVSFLDGVRDRLSYRSAPLGLLSRGRFGHLRFPVGVPSGEDIPFVTALWFSGARITYDRRGPAYLGHADASDRTSGVARPVDVEFTWLRVLLTDPVYRGLSAEQRAAVVAKSLRINLFGAVLSRNTPSAWLDGDRTALAAVADTLVREGDGIHEVLSRRDRTLLDAILDPGSPIEELIELARARRRFLSAGALLPRRLSHTLHREAPLRMAAATALQLL